MAYITKEQVSSMRANIKKEFPTKEGWKFSITREDGSGIKVNIIKAPYDIIDPKCKDSEYPRESINNYYLETIEDERKRDDLIKLNNICNEGNWDKSDIMTDYFNIGWYVWISIGSYDKPFIYEERK